MPKDTHNSITHDDNEIIDHEQFEDMRELLEEDFADLIDVFIVDSHKRIAALRDAHKNNDNANGFEIAHAMKGASANLGATQLLALSSQLQELCRAQKISEQATLIEDISIALQNLEQAIQKRLGS